MGMAFMSLLFGGGGESANAYYTKGDVIDVGGAPFLLVTSAYHMPRAMLLMRRAGAAPIAAPAGQRAYGTGAVAWRDFVPGSRGLRDTERALHEYAGLAAIASGLE